MYSVKERLLRGEQMEVAMVPKISKLVPYHQPRARRIPGQSVTWQTYHEGLTERGYRKTCTALGWVYIIRLVPDLNPLRVKVGFTSQPERRRKEILTTAPGAQLVKLIPGSDDLEVLGHRTAAHLGHHVGGEVWDMPNEVVLQYLVRFLKRHADDPLMGYERKDVRKIERGELEKCGLLETGASGDWIEEERGLHLIRVKAKDTKEEDHS